MGKGFDPDIHRPIELSPEEIVTFGCDVGFVGHWEPSREETLLWLAEQKYHIRVWGGGWERARYKNHPLFFHCPHLVGNTYAKAICGAKINLCFLSCWFGDKTTARSVEIPACGKFLLAERNEEHMALFREGVEAEFYSTREEMLAKINYYLVHADKREAIAKAGRKRCLEHYSNKALLKDMFGRILEPNPQFAQGDGLTTPVIEQ
jgi:spore maturation protein CgeB